ncbi:MAG: translocation/assembly module TamB domain-containing protein [Ferruginibacter sp.]
MAYNEIPVDITIIPLIFGIEFALRRLTLFLQQLINTLRKSLNILKWFFLTLIFWLVLAILLIYVLPDFAEWVFIISLAGWLGGWLFVFRKTVQKTWFFLSLILLVIFTWGILQLSVVQNYVIGKVASALSDKLHAKVSVQHINYRFFDKMAMKGLMVEDQKKDTLLFAGNAIVNITDWFFLKNKATLKYVALDDAVVNMQRIDSIWNYQFLVDYFGGPADSSARKKGGIEFDIKIFQFTNIRFNQLDKWVGKNMRVAVKKLDLYADEVNFTKKLINLNTLTIDEPVYIMEDYKGKRPDFPVTEMAKKIDPDPQPYQWNNDGWVMNVNKIQITNGVFNHEIDTERPAYPGRFDGQHLRFGNITGVFKNVRLEKDTLSAELLLGTRERSGFEVKKLEAKFKFTPERMEFNQLDLITNKSRLGNYYVMKYGNFGKDMGNFTHNINLECNFSNSEINSDDLAFFAPELKPWKRILSIKGIAKGTIDNITTKRMQIKSGNSFVDGDISLRGLPDIKKTFIDFRANDLQTTYDDISAIIPSLKNITQPQVSKLGNIRYKGNFTGFINDFVAFGSINTRLGIVTGDINMKLPGNKSPIYLGKISTEGFKLGEFFNNNQLDAITFNGKVKGSGFTENDMDANFDGYVRSLGFAGYAYQNINIKGDFGKKIFTGLVSIDDPNLKLDSLRGTIDMSGKVPQFGFNATLAKADLKKLKYTADDFVLNGRFYLNFAGNNIDNFLGTAKIYDASLTHNNAPLSFDSLVLQSSIAGNQKYLTIHTNELDADLTGNFKILELPDAFKIFLSRYYPAYIKKPSYAVSDQHFSFLVKTKEADAYIQLLDKRLSGFSNSTISGNLNLKENELNVNADIPLFSYDGKVFNNIRLASRGNLDSLLANIDVDEIRINDSLHLPASKLVFTSHNDISDISIKTRASKTFGDATVNARLQTLKDGVKIHFFPSSLIINDKKWELEKDGELTLSKSLVSANEVKFIQGNQQIIISTEPSEISDSHDVVITLKEVNINDFAPFVLKNPRLEGQITGSIHILDPFGKPFIEFETKINEFRLDGDSIGIVNGKGDYSVATGIAKIKLDAENINNRFKIEGIINTKDTTENQVDIAMVSERLNLAILNNYLGSIFSDIRGNANTADLKVKGNSRHLAITGTANINEGSLVVNYTQCRYKFSNESIIFNPDEIDFGSIILKDTLNNKATLSGKMYHRFFQDFFFSNVKFETGKLLVLNTTKKDNSQFYGKVIGQAQMTLNGPVDNMTMNISGEPSRSDTSHIYLLSGSSVESGVVDYVDFIQFGSKMEDEFRDKLSSNILVNMVLTANPSCKIDVILDEATGDIIKGEGNGLLKIRVGNKEPLTINGDYNITKGEYTFNFQTFLKKYFTVNRGIITWSGDPLNARIDILAEYLASKVDFKPISTAGTRLNQKEDVIVVAHLTETLLKPAIDFEFQLPAASPLKSDFVITKRLQQFKDDKNELNKQVTSLLLFNSFTSSTQGFITASSGYSVLSSTIGGVVSNALSGYFNKFLQKYIKNTSLYLDLNSGLELESNVSKLQAAAKSGLVFTLLNGRLIITAGVNLDYNNPYVINTGRNNNLLVTPDITAEWILSKDGRIRLVGFNRTNYDLVSQRTRTGISLSFRKDFDKLTQLFTADAEKKRLKAMKQVTQSE